MSKEINRREFLKVGGILTMTALLGLEIDGNKQVAKAEREQDIKGFKGEDELPSIDYEFLPGWQEKEAPVITFCEEEVEDSIVYCRTDSCVPILGSCSGVLFKAERGKTEERLLGPEGKPIRCVVDEMGKQIK